MTAGERWAAGELAELRAAGFSPAAWTRFLSESWRRAAATRRSRNSLARQAHVWSVAGLATGVRAAAGARRNGIAAPHPAAWAAWWLSAAAMLDWHLGMVEGPAGESRERLSAADGLTLVRVGLVPFIAAQRASDQATFAVLMTAAASTDVADGVLARRHGPTRLGRDLDAAADVLVGAAGVRAARRAGWIGPVAGRLALARHALPVAVVAAGYFGTDGRPTAFATTRPAAPALVGGLVVAPFAPHLANALVLGGSLAGLVLARPRSTG